MARHELEGIIAAADDAINREDFDEVMELYADDADAGRDAGQERDRQGADPRSLDAKAANLDAGTPAAKTYQSAVERVPGLVALRLTP